MVEVWILLAALIGAASLTWVLIKFFTLRRWLDEPDHRSAHVRPMPSAGGLGMLVPFLLATGYFVTTGAMSAKTGLLLFGCLPIALVGLIDDFRRLSIRVRLPVQVASAVWVVYWVGELQAVPFGSWTLEHAAVLRLLAIVSFVWLLNLFNFMDGIDGLAATETGFVTLLSCLLVITAEDTSLITVASLTCAVAMGFLFWNWAPAKIFMGDTGSNFLAFVIGALALISLGNGSLNPWTWLLLLGIFVVDSSYTLLVRVLTRQRWYAAHSSHGYQVAARRLNSHQRVTLLALAINVGWLAPLAWLATRHPQAGLFLTALGWMPLVVLAALLGAGKTEKNSGATG